MIHLGVTLKNQSELKDAQQLLEDALDYIMKHLKRIHGDDDVPDNPQLAECYHSLGLVYTEQQELDSGEKARLATLCIEGGGKHTLELTPRVCPPSHTVPDVCTGDVAAPAPWCHAL